MAVTEVILPYLNSLSTKEVNALLQHADIVENSIKSRLAPLFVISRDARRTHCVYWEKFYRECCNMRVDLSSVRIPKKPHSGRWRLIIIAQGITINQIVLCYQKMIGRCLRKYAKDLDCVVTKNARTSIESYALWVSDESAPDIDYFGRSALDVDPDGAIGITLLERLVYGVVYFSETKKHLDQEGWTLCTGSRNFDDYVPCVYWNLAMQEVCVCLCRADVVLLCSRLRRTVSY